jgi:galactokinase
VRPSLLSLDPVPELLSRMTPAPAGTTRISRAPGRLDVMGGIADYTGSLVCEATLSHAAAVGLRQRDDNWVDAVSFNLTQNDFPSRFKIPLPMLAAPALVLRHELFNHPDRNWAGYVVGCLNILHEHRWIDLKDKSLRGLDLAVWSTVPLGAGLSSSAAIEVATMMNLCSHFGLLDGKVSALQLAAMCQEVENRVVGAPCGIMDQVASCCGQADSLMRMLCQPHELLAPLALPQSVRVIGIDSRVRHSVGGGSYGRTRCAAFMGHKIILEKMREMGVAAGKTMEGDPMRGLLANLNPDDYKRFFRPFLPEEMIGRDFIAQFVGTIDKATSVDAAVSYHVQRATDHHVLEANRVRNFVSCLESAGNLPADSSEFDKQMNKAGHLMYASHQSYTNNALLGADECDLLVQLVREREPSGFYGAKITGGGAGGTVAVLCRHGAATDAAIAEVIAEYRAKTGNAAYSITGSSPGAWQAGTAIV